MPEKENLPTASLFIASPARIGPGSNLGFRGCSSGTNRLKVFGLKCLLTDEATGTFYIGTVFSISRKLQ